MSDVTIITVSKADLTHMLEKAVSKAVQEAAERSQELWTAGDVAKHYGVCPRTIAIWYKQPGRLPPKQGGRWRRCDILRWDKDRQSVQQ